MGKQGRRLLLFCALAAFCGLVFSSIVSAPGEPGYQGRTLSAWLADYPFPTASTSAANTPVSRPQTVAEIKQIETAVREIGTNGLPALVQWLRAEDSPIRMNFARLAARHSWMPFHPLSSREKNLMALGGFRILGRIAQPAIPALRALLRDDHAGVRLRAAIVLREIEMEPGKIETAQNGIEPAVFDRTRPVASR